MVIEEIRNKYKPQRNTEEDAYCFSAIRHETATQNDNGLEESLQCLADDENESDSESESTVTNPERCLAVSDCNKEQDETCLMVTVQIAQI